VTVGAEAGSGTHSVVVEDAEVPEAFVLGS
jgi:hypothetical protein